MTSNPSFDLGPQYPKDPPFTARMRRHQSWFRANVLKVPYGTGPKPSNSIYYGNMLTPADGEEGRNFLTPHIFEVAKRRIAEKKGMAVDSFRLLCNMLSSQPMCFNLFGPLVDDQELATELFQAIFPGEVAQVTKVHLEHAPQPSHEYLDDRTAFDVFIEYLRIDGSAGFIGVETKLTESFTPKAFVRPAYWQWIKREASPWPADSWPKLIEPQVNQVWRDHLLAESMLHHAKSRYTAGRLLVVYHPSDALCVQSLDAYRALLKQATPGFSQIALDELVSRWMVVARTENDRKWLGDFVTRYLDLSLSETEE